MEFKVSSRTCQSPRSEDGDSRPVHVRTDNKGRYISLRSEDASEEKHQVHDEQPPPGSRIVEEMRSIAFASSIGGRQGTGGSRVSKRTLPSHMPWSHQGKDGAKREQYATDEVHRIHGVQIGISERLDARGP